MSKSFRTVPRGVRNNNPGNIDWSPSNDWVGQLPHDPTVESRFARFDTPQNGVRAMAMLLQTYQNRHKLDTVRKIVGRWAPPNENDTKAYARAVAAALGVSLDDPIDVKDHAVMRTLVVEKIRVECAGHRYPDDVVDEGLRRAGIIRRAAAKPAAKAATPIAALAAPAAAAAVAEAVVPGQVTDLAVAAVTKAADAGLEPGRIILVVAVALAAAGAAIAWRRFRRAKLEG